jgi:hypothetical protein
VTTCPSGRLGLLNFLSPSTLPALNPIDYKMGAEMLRIIRK